MNYIICHDIPCVSREMIEDNYSAEDQASFWKFMDGQTGILSDTGEPLYYAWDYERWLNQGKPVQQGADWD